MPPWINQCLRNEGLMRHSVPNRPIRLYVLRMECLRCAQLSQKYASLPARDLRKGGFPVRLSEAQPCLNAPWRGQWG